MSVLVFQPALILVAVITRKNRIDCQNSNNGQSKESEEILKKNDLKHYQLLRERDEQIIRRELGDQY